MVFTVPVFPMENIALRTYFRVFDVFIYKYSFIPRTISDWNKLPPEVILSPSVDSFREGLKKQM
jgi:hypothetical protein